MNQRQITAMAMVEIMEEDRRAAVAAEKERLRAKENQSPWQRLLDKLPFTIHIERKKA